MMTCFVHFKTAIRREGNYSCEGPPISFRRESSLSARPQPFNCLYFYFSGKTNAPTLDTLWLAAEEICSIRYM